MLSDSKSSKNDGSFLDESSPICEIQNNLEALWYVYSNKKFGSLFGHSTKSSKYVDYPAKRWGHSVIILGKSMILFGGRHSQRSLANIFSFDLSSLVWSKLDPYGQTPPARDSHSAIQYKNEMIVFGGSGSGKKLNDLWIFNLDSRRWSKLNTTGDLPCEREGHSSVLIRGSYMMVYGGLDEEDSCISAINILDLKSNVWYLASTSGEEPSLRDSQSCTMVNNTCYVFGGQGTADTRFNDLYTLNFDIKVEEKRFSAEWAKEVVHGVKPPVRTSHCSVAYKSHALIVLGGEGEHQVPLNDVWLYNIPLKTWTELIIKNSNIFEGRLCHSACLFGEKILIYGGMKNAESTLDTFAILCLDGKTEDLEEAENYQNNTNYNISNANNNYSPTMNNGNANIIKNSDHLNAYLSKEEDFIIVSNNLKALASTIDKKANALHLKDIGTDTSDLLEDNSFNFEELKKNYLNNLISWSFLKKIAEFNQWPLGCIGNIVENSMKEEVASKNIAINVKCYDKKVYTRDINTSASNCLKDYCDFTEKIIVLSIIDDGKGINIKDFNKIMYSFSVNEKKEYNFFQYGVSLKASAIRLANSFFILSKTESEFSIGLISKNMQNKLGTDLILTPIVNYQLENKNQDNTAVNNIEYTPKSNFALQSLNLILNEVKFLFCDYNELFKYVESFSTGTHIFLYDLRQISNNPSEVNLLKNYELLFDYDKKDILFNYFNLQIGENNFIDCSFVKYLKYFCIKHPNISIYVFDEKINLVNPISLVCSMAKNTQEAIKVYGNLKSPSAAGDCVYLEGDLYKGVLFNENFLKILSNSSCNYDIESIENSENELFNGILLYRENRLISRVEQHKLGDISYFIKKYEKMLLKKENFNKNRNEIANSLFFPISGYVELSASCYDLLCNKTEFKDQSIYAYFYSKLKSILKKINK